MKILHLYHDLMNLYGDYANVSALCRMLELNNIEFSLDKKSLGDEVDFSEYDFIYIGSGSEENMKLALSSLKEKRDELAEYIENEKFLLLTGNSFEMLGEKITSFLGEFEGLGIFPFTVTEQNKPRTTDDSVVNFPEADLTLVGFINKCSEIEGITTPMFNVEMGLSNGKNQKTEGIRYKNLFGTHLTGPLFVKNPIFLKYIAEKLTGTELVDYGFSFERKGYEITLNKLRERNGK